MLVGDLTVRMAADMADLRSGFDKMRGEAEQFGKNVGAAVDAAKTALAALGVTLSVGMFAHAIKETIDYADKLNDLSKITGIGVESLGGLGYAASTAGVSLDDVAKGAGKLADFMAKAASGNAEAAGAFDKMGISIVGADGALTDMDETLFAVADQFASYKDGPEKAALAHELFGKSGAALIPLLNEGGDKLRAMVEEYRKYGGVTKETAERADAFNDTMSKLHLMSGAFTRELTAALLPVLQAVANIFVDAKAKGEGFGGVIPVIVSGFKLLVSAAMYAVEIIMDVGKGLGALAAAAVAIAGGDFKGAVDVIKGYSTDVKTSWGKTAEDVDKVWSSTAVSLVTTSNDKGPKISAPLVKAGADAIQKFKDLEAEFVLMAAADAAGLATNTVKQLGDLMTLLETGKISREDYDKWLGLVLDKDPKLKAEQDALNKAMADARAAIDKMRDSWDKESRSLDERIQKQLDANETFGLGKAALIDLQIAHLDEQIAMERSGPYMTKYGAHLDEVRAKLLKLRDAVAVGEALDQQKRDLDAAQKAWDKYIDDVSKSFSNFLQDWVENGASKAFKDLWENFKKWALAALAEIAAKQIVVSITGALGVTAAGGANAGGLEALLGGGSGGGGLGGLGSVVSGLGSLLGDAIFGGGGAAAFMSGLASPIATLTDVAAVLTTTGAEFASGTLALATAAGALVPVVGTIAAAGALLYNFLSKPGGGPKEGGFAATGATPGIGGVDPSGRWMTPSGSDPQMAAAVANMNTMFEKLLAALGGTGSAVFAQGFSTDPKGTAPSNVHTGAWVNGVQIFDNPNGNVGRSSEELKAELEAQSMRAILAALQASALPEVVADYLRSIDVSTASVEQIAAALAHAAELKVLVDQVSALPKDMADGLLDALGVSDDLDAQIAEFATQFAAFTAASNDLSDALDRDPAAEVAALSKAQETQHEKVLRLREGLADLVGEYDGSTEATAALAKATNEYVDAQVQALLQIEQLKTGLGSMFADSIKQLDWAIMSNEQRGAFLLTEAENTTALLRQTTDPAKIQEFSQLINHDLVDAFNLLSPEEQLAQHDAFVQRLKDADALVQAQLEASRQEISADNANAQTVLGSIRAAMDVAAEKQQEAAQQLIDAAAAMRTAAQIITDAANKSSAAADMNSTAADRQAAAAAAQQRAADTPITVEVEYQQGGGP